eukprot:SAG31_NODE_149_length_22476_cov_41.827189_5_plen_100_part_00
MAEALRCEQQSRPHSLSLADRPPLAAARAPGMADGSSASEPAETFSTNEMFKAIQAKAENDHSDNPLMVCLGYAIHPNNYWRLKWDLFMFVLVLYSSVV